MRRLLLAFIYSAIQYEVKNTKIPDSNTNNGKVTKTLVTYLIMHSLTSIFFCQISCLGTVCLLGQEPCGLVSLLEHQTDFIQSRGVKLYMCYKSVSNLLNSLPLQWTYHH